MTKDIALIILGFLVLLLPFLGFPGSWESVLLVLFGFGIITLAFFLRKEIVGHPSQHGSQKGKKTDVFVENGEHQVPQTSSQSPHIDIKTPKKIRPIGLYNEKDTTENE